MPVLPKSIPLGSSTGTLELKATKENAHSSRITSIAFNPVDGKTIVSGSWDKTIKIWDAFDFRPFNASEWEEVDISGMEKDGNGEVEIEGLGFIKSNYWKNTVTGDLRKEHSTAGELLTLEPIKVCGIQVSWSQKMPVLPKSTLPGSSTGTLELKATKENAHKEPITSVGFNPVDGKTIVSGSFDKTIKVWGLRALAWHSP